MAEHCERCGTPITSTGCAAKPRGTVLAAQQEPDNGNTFVFCDYVSDGMGCVRGAGHDGLHVLSLPPYPMGPVTLAAAPAPQGETRPTNDALLKLANDLRESARIGYLFDHHDEPLDAAGKRIVRVIEQRAEYFAALSAPVPALSETGVPGSEVLCEECAKVFCPHVERLHFHHDGCPACDADASPAVPALREQDIREKVQQFMLNNWALLGFDSRPFAKPSESPALATVLFTFAQSLLGGSATTETPDDVVGANQVDEQLRFCGVHPDQVVVRYRPSAQGGIDVFRMRCPLCAALPQPPR